MSSLTLSTFTVQSRRVLGPFAKQMKAIAESAHISEIILDGSNQTGPYILCSSRETAVKYFTSLPQSTCSIISPAYETQTLSSPAESAQNGSTSDPTMQSLSAQDTALQNSTRARPACNTLSQDVQSESSVHTTPSRNALSQDAAPQNSTRAVPSQDYSNQPPRAEYSNQSENESATSALRKRRSSPLIAMTSNNKRRLNEKMKKQALEICEEVTGLNALDASSGSRLHDFHRKYASSFRLLGTLSIPGKSIRRPNLMLIIEKAHTFADSTALLEFQLLLTQWRKTDTHMTSISQSNSNLLLPSSQDFHQSSLPLHIPESNEKDSIMAELVRDYACATAAEDRAMLAILQKRMRLAQFWRTFDQAIKLRMASVQHNTSRQRAEQEVKDGLIRCVIQNTPPQHALDRRNDNERKMLARRLRTSSRWAMFQSRFGAFSFFLLSSQVTCSFIERLNELENEAFQRIILDIILKGTTFKRPFFQDFVAKFVQGDRHSLPCLRLELASLINMEQCQTEQRWQMLDRIK